MEPLWMTILGLIGLLSVAVLILPAAERLNFPFTVLLALVGILIGVGIEATSGGEAHGVVGDLLRAFDSVEITSEAILFVFLPALVFESSLAIDVRRLLDDIGPILFLAVVGLLISTFIVGGALWAASGVAFVVCLLLGAIVSATDPVAVVAIFKNLGAPKRLTILVEGESLFNDATAIVMFNILAAMVLGSAVADLGAGAGAFVKVFVGGIVVGYICARIVCAIIARLRDLPLVEITLTISLAYLSFLIAEHYLHVSGVMAVVTAALVVGSYGRTTISGETWHGLIETWEQLGFWANSLIFVLVGMAVPHILGDFGGRELWLLIILIVTAIAARAVIIFGLLPLLQRTGLADMVSTGFKTVMLWGGLRGAVSLALALAVMENPAFASEDRTFIGILVTGFVLFTLFVKATTIQWVLRMFGLDKLSVHDLAIRDRVVAASLADVGGDIEAVARDQQIAPELAQKVIDHFQARFAAAQSPDAAAQAINDEDWLLIGLAALADQESKDYLHQYAEGRIPSAVARTLLGQVDDLRDALKQRGVTGYQEAVADGLKFSRTFQLALQLQRRFGLQGPLAQRLADRFEVLLANRSTVAALRDKGMKKVLPLVGAAASERLQALLNERLKAVESALGALQKQYPAYAMTLQARHLEQISVRLEEASYRRLYQDGVIGHEVFVNLESELKARARKLAERPKLDLGLRPEELVAKVPLFAGLPAVRIAEIAQLLKPQLAIPGEYVMRKGEPGDEMFFISSGSLEVAVEPEPAQLGSGDFVGEIALLRDQPRVADVVAQGFCDLLSLSVRDFRDLLKVHPEMRETMEQVAGERLKGKGDSD